MESAAGPSLILLSPSLNKEIGGHNFAYNLSLAEIASDFFTQVKILAGRTYKGPDNGYIEAVIHRPDFSALKYTLRSLINHGDTGVSVTAVATCMEKHPKIPQGLFRRLLRSIKCTFVTVYYAFHLLHLLRKRCIADTHILIEDTGFWELAALPLLLRFAGKPCPVTWHLILRHPPECFAGVFPSLRDLQQRLKNICIQTRAPVYCYTDTERLSAAYRCLTGHVEQFETVPVPMIRKVSCALIRQTTELRLGSMGGPRVDKGFTALPLLYERLPARSAGREISLVIQIAPQVERGTEDTVRRLKSLPYDIRHPRLELFADPDAETYAEIFSSLHVLLLLYTGYRYCLSSSGIFVEAVQYGIPVLAYAGSWADAVMRTARARGLNIGLSVENLSEVSAALTHMATEFGRYQEDMLAFQKLWLPEHDMRQVAATIVNNANIRVMNQ
jgi:hypothetical protein